MEETDAALAVRAAEAGAVVVRSKYDGQLRRIDKPAGDFATQADVAWTDGDVAYLRSSGRDEPLVPGRADGLVELNLDSLFPNQFRAARLLHDESFTGSFRPRVLSTTLALAWVAAGRRAAYITDGHLRDSVHFTSGIALCQAISRQAF